MKKVLNCTRYSFIRPLFRLVLQLLGVTIALLLLIQQTRAQGLQPAESINIKLTNKTLEEGLQSLKQQTNIDIIFNHEMIKNAPRITVDIQNATVELALSELLKNSHFTYKNINQTYVITPEVEESKSEAPGLKQTLRGQIIDQESKSPLPYATVQVVGTDPLKGATSDLDGNFRIENLPIGRYTIKVTFVGYEDAYLSEVLVGSGKETVLTIGLTESLTSLNEVVVTTNSGEMLNEMAVVSAKSFDAEETKRYAASMSDPARMAQVFAGVAATDDVANEIVIRGNSPNWLLWKLEGVEIPSPNHFAEEGYSSGAISILSSNMLGSSDFYTGAFSADYGNALSGVFDLRLRNGNNQTYEHTFQAGVLGFDIASEGPFKKGYKGSYLFNYRYSTLSVLNNLNIEVSENALPNYQDLSFKLNLPTKAGTFSLWGIGGLSDIASTYLPDSTDNDFDESYDDFTKTGMYATGITHTYFINNDSYIETVLSSSRSFSSQDYEELDTLGVLRDEFYDNLSKSAIRLSSFYNRKHSSRLTMRYGVILNQLNYDYTSREFDEEENKWVTALDTDGETSLYQGYVMAKYKFTDKLIATAGVHTTYFALNDDIAVEPRLGLAYDLNPSQKLTIGYGMHSRHENLPVYFVETTTPDGNKHLLNKDLKLTRAHHFVVGYSKAFNQKLHLKTEVYYQHIDKLPVPNNPEKYWSPIFGGFSDEDTLINAGQGRNFGVEMTLQKYFSNQYYFLITSSVFDSKYKPLDGKWYDTRFNINYVNNLVGGKEWTLSNNRLLGLNTKVMWSGGKRQLPIDLEESKAEGETVYKDGHPWSYKTQDYFRVDLGVKMHFFRKNKEHVLSLDIQNVTNRLNTWAQYYDSDTDEIIDAPMAGAIPILNYRLEF